VGGDSGFPPPLYPSLQGGIFFKLMFCKQSLDFARRGIGMGDCIGNIFWSLGTACDINPFDIRFNSLNFAGLLSRNHIHLS